MKRFTLLVSILLIGCISFSFAAGGRQRAGEKTVLRVAHFHDPATGEAQAAALAWFNQVKAEFERQNPNVVVEWELQAWNEIDVKLMSDFRSNITDHDVSLTTPQLFPLHAEIGDLEDMNPFIQRDWSAAQIAELSWASTYQQGLQNGKQIAIPLGSHARVFIWNKDHFRAAGLDPERPPRNLDELVEYAKRLTIDKDGDGVIDQYGFGLPLVPDRNTIENSFSPLIWGFGGDSIDPATRAAVFADANGVRAAEWIWDLVNTHKVVPPDAITNTYDTARYFMAEKISMSFSWGAYYTVELENAGWATGLLPPRPNARLIKVGVAQYPTATGNDFTNSWSISIYQKSKNKELAWKFIDTLFKANLNEYPEAGLPIKQAEWQRPEYQTEYFKVFNEAIRIGKPMAQTPYYGDLADTISAALQRCLSAPRSDIRRILQEAQQEYNSKAR
jgi:ABC-type glycerol-3-phosphate transport system substrate-binding protein